MARSHAHRDGGSGPEQRAAHDALGLPGDGRAESRQCAERPGRGPARPGRAERRPAARTGDGPMTAWWRDAVIYQVYVRSFADGNGDGVGDLPGVRSRLPYLRELGVDAVWLTPFYASPMADGGYDVADYRDVDPLFGSLADAESLISEAHDLGLRLIVDIVPNHSSYLHEWFEAALAAGPGSSERERYIFRAGRGADGSEPPNDWESMFGGPAWQRVPDGEWYLRYHSPSGTRCHAGPPNIDSQSLGGSEPSAPRPAR